MDSIRIKLAGGAGLLLLAVVMSACAALPRPPGGGARNLPPPPTREPSGPATATPEPVSVPDETTRDQLEIFDFIWTQVSQGYAYADYNGADWNGLRRIYRTQVEDGMTDEMFQAAMQAMVSELGDENTAYVTRAEIEEQLAEQQASADAEEAGYVGTLVGMPDGTRQQMTILYVFPGSPAEEAGVQPHDVIVGIEGEPVPDEPEDDILERIRGEVGTQVLLTVQAPGEEPRDLSVGRAPLGQGGEIEVRTIDDNIGYIFIPPGTEEASLGVRVTNALRTLQQDDDIEALILDLRIARVAQEWPVDELLGLFVHGEAYELYNVTESQAVSATGKDVAGSQSLPLVVLVSHDTLGLSEVFAGALQALGRATIVGGQTQGQVELVANIPVSQGGGDTQAQDEGEDQPTETPQDTGEDVVGVLALTVATARSLGGETWGRAGVSPDVEVDLRWEDFSADDDPQLEAAIEAAKGLIQ